MLPDIISDRPDRRARPSRAARLACFAAGILLVAGTGAATPTLARRALPPSLLGAASPIGTVAQVRMPAVDRDALVAEDANLERSGEAYRPRFATPLAVELTPDAAGTWETLADGSRLWRLRISSPGAVSLNLALHRFDLPPGAAMWLHDPDGAQVQGPYTAADQNPDGGLWTPIVLGDELVVELLLPPGARDRADLEISSLNHGYRGFGESAAVEAVPKQGSCNIDVICPEGDPWRRQIRSVARISVLGVYWCSATLLNNTAEDDRPYLLTANHCLESAGEAISMVTYWNYESPICGLLGGGRPTQNQVGSTLVATWAYQSGSDFTLVELDDLPDASYNVYYAGWNATGSTPQGVVGIHHPAADEKAISFDFDPLVPDNHYGFGDHQWKVEAWDLGTTEGGSSGSCIFDSSSGLCVGTLTAGTASCTNPDGYDVYGRFDVHWIGNGTPSSRVSDWLDPIGSGALVLEGKEPGTGGGGGGGSGVFDTLWLIPAAASTPGAEGADWRSELVVVNPTTEPRTTQLHYIAETTSWPGVPLLAEPVVIPPGQTLYLDDPLASLNPTSGMLAIAVSGQGTVVSSRTYNQDPDGGTFGQGIPGVLVDDLTPPTRLILPLVHSSPGRFRTNLGLVQTSAGTYTVRVSAYTAGGSLLATKNIGVAAGFRQINDVFRELGVPDATVDGGRLEVELLGAAPAYWTCYASVVDDRTNDPTYVLPVRP